jgi:chromosome segregation ATPase
MPIAPEAMTTLAAELESKIAAIDARTAAIRREVKPLEKKGETIGEVERAQRSALRTEEIQLLRVSNELLWLLAQITDSSKAVADVAEAIKGSRDATKAAVASINKLPKKIADGASLAGQVATAIPKALDGIDKVLDVIEEKLNT